MEITPRLKAWLVEHAEISKQASDEQFEAAAAKALTDGTLSIVKLTELVTDEGGSQTNPRTVFGGKATGSSVRVKAASERYSSTRKAAKHAKTGLPVRDERGQEVEHPSQRDFAKAGAFLKFKAQRQGVNCVLTEHEKGLLGDCFEDRWVGRVGNEWKDDLSGEYVKALLDDATSGGQEVTPDWFDEAIVTYPLLSGELYPFVDRQDVPRSATVEGAAISAPTATWGTSEGTALTVFTTTSLVSDLSTTIFPVAVGVEIGRDFLADSPVDVGRVLVEAVGQRMASELDKVIAVGNGTTQPQGISIASGLTSVSATNGSSGPPTVTDHEGLIFGVPKQYRVSSSRCAFIANDVSYQRARGIPVSGTDERRVFGMDHQSYRMLDYRYAVNGSLANTVIAFGALAKYRMYRRAGFEVRFETAGKTLSLSNLALLLVRGRFGGRVVDANAFAKISNAQS